MLKTLWEWWIEGLTGPWPGALRQWLQGRRRRVWATDTRDGFEFAAGRQDPDSWTVLWKDEPKREMPAAVRRRLRAADIVLRLPAHTILQRTVAIPPHSDSSTYIRQRMDEFSPFPPDQTCFGALGSVDSPDADLVIAPRADVDSQLQRLREAGFRARAVTAEGFEHTTLDMMPADHQRPARRDLTGVVMVAAGGVACAVAVALPVMEQSRVLRGLDGEKQRLELQLARGEGARETIQQLRRRAAAIAGRGEAGSDAVALLAEITNAVPDHTWVRQLILRDGELTLHGESTDTADLITRLEASPRMRNVRYDTAITRDSDSGTDRFKLTAEINGSGS